MIEGFLSCLKNEQVVRPAYEFPPWGSVAVFVTMYVLLLIIIIRKAKIVSLDMIGGDVLP